MCRGAGGDILSDAGTPGGASEEDRGQEHIDQSSSTSDIRRGGNGTRLRLPVKNSPESVLDDEQA